jgi:hypothetical protein
VAPVEPLTLARRVGAPMPQAETNREVPPSQPAWPIGTSAPWPYACASGGPALNPKVLFTLVFLADQRSDIAHRGEFELFTFEMS